ncbi:hypothetical protein [Xanthomonas phage DMF5-T1]|nr:hypothetical protein [Xanthomonas phage DMF5-T1]
MSILRGDELTPGEQYWLLSTRQTDQLSAGLQFVASKLLTEDGARALVQVKTGSVLYATANDIFSAQA